MSSKGTSTVRIGLHQMSGLRRPKDPLAGDGPVERVAGLRRIFAQLVKLNLKATIETG